MHFLLRCCIMYLHLFMHDKFIWGFFFSFGLTCVKEHLHYNPAHKLHECLVSFFNLARSFATICTNNNYRQWEVSL